jgi:hypothetical protein
VASERYILKHTPPSRNNTKIAFPDHYPQGRIEIEQGRKIMDWNGEEWILFIKDGVRWYQEEFSNEEFILLETVLSDR